MQMYGQSSPTVLATYLPTYLATERAGQLPLISNLMSTFRNHLLLLPKLFSANHISTVNQPTFPPLEQSLIGRATINYNPTVKMKTADTKAVAVNFMREFCEGMKTLDVDPAKSNPGDLPLFPVYFKVSPPDDDLVTKSSLQIEVEIDIHNLDPPNILDIKPVQPLFLLLSLVVQAAVQDTGRVLDRKTNFHMSGTAMRCLPFLYASDAANSLFS